MLRPPDGPVHQPADGSGGRPYSGTLDNRLRFAMEVLAACRERVGPDFLLGLRYVGG
jgi:N-methyl-L-proline demethylase